MWLLESDISTV